MEKANKQIIYEAIVLQNAYSNAIKGFDDKEYSSYNNQNAGWYIFLSGELSKIVGIPNKGERTIDDFTSYVASINITPEQMKELHKLRKEPMLKRLMGETALQQKDELEKVLGGKISNQGRTFADENGPKISYKTEKQLEQELDAYYTKLAELQSSGTISMDQFDNYNQSLDYIYSYFISQARGEQIPFRKLTNAQYEQIQKRAEENDVDFSKQMSDETRALMEENAELQKLQGSTKKII